MPAFAQAQLGGGFDLSGSVSAQSDYRFRGISLTGEDPAVQGSVTVGHSSGAYAGVWASSLSGRSGLGQAEFDLYAGYSTGIAPGTTLDAGVLYYLYTGREAGNPNRSRFEPCASISYVIGPVTAKAGAAYAPDQGEATAFGDNLFVYGELSAGIPTTPITLTAHLGRSSGALSPGGDYIEWRVGGEVALGRGFFAGASYVDTDLPDAFATGPTLVGSLRWSF